MAIKIESGLTEINEELLSKSVKELKITGRCICNDIMAKFGAGYLLKADITKVDSEFSINYQLYNNDGSISDKSIFSNDILSSIPIISEQLNTALNITTEKVKSKLLSFNCVNWLELGQP